AAHVPEARLDVAAPAGAVAGRLRRVEAQAGDHREGVAAVGVDRDPLALALLAPVAEAPGGHRALEQLRPRLAERVAHGAGAVVAVVFPAGVTASPLVGLADDLVGRADRSLDPRRRVRRWHGLPVGPELRLAPRNGGP